MIKKICGFAIFHAMSSSHLYSISSWMTLLCFFVRSSQRTQTEEGLLLEYLTLQSLRLMQTSRLCIILINQVSSSSWHIKLTKINAILISFVHDNSCAHKFGCGYRNRTEVCETGFSNPHFYRDHAYIENNRKSHILAAIILVISFMNRHTCLFSHVLSLHYAWHPVFRQYGGDRGNMQARNPCFLSF